MSLVVSAYWRDLETGITHEFTDWDYGRYMAGVESDRQDLWGSDAIRRLGARFFPQLADSDLWVPPEELEAFMSEVYYILANVAKLRAELGRAPDCPLRRYLGNFIRATEYAISKGGGISIT